MVCQLPRLLGSMLGKSHMSIIVSSIWVDRRIRDLGRVTTHHLDRLLHPEPEGRPREPGEGTRAEGVTPELFYGPLVLLAFLLALGSLEIYQAIPIHEAS